MGLNVFWLLFVIVELVVLMQYEGDVLRNYSIVSCSCWS